MEHLRLISVIMTLNFLIVEMLYVHDRHLTQDALSIAFDI